MKTKLRNYYIQTLENQLKILELSFNLNEIEKDKVIEAICFFYKVLENCNNSELLDYHINGVKSIKNLLKQTLVQELKHALKKDIKFHNDAITYYEGKMNG